MLEYCSAEISELAKALIAVQRELLPAARDGTNPFTRSNYATLNSVMGLAVMSSSHMVSG